MGGNIEIFNKVIKRAVDVCSILSHAYGQNAGFYCPTGETCTSDH